MEKYKRKDLVELLYKKWHPRFYREEIDQMVLDVFNIIVNDIFLDPEFQEFHLRGVLGVFKKTNTKKTLRNINTGEYLGVHPVPNIKFTPSIQIIEVLKEYEKD